MGPQISASLNPCLGSFFLQQVVINTETHTVATDNMQRVRDFGVLTLSKTFISQSTPASSEVYKEEITGRS